MARALKIESPTMKTPFFLAVVGSLLACFGGAAGAARVEALDAYMRQIIAEELPKQGNSAAWDGCGNGGYLVRQLVDVTGDGQAELLLIGTLAAHPNYGEWTVFDIAPSGDLRPYGRSVSLMAGAVSLARVDQVTELRCEWPPDVDSDEGMKNRLLPEGTVRHRLSRFVFSYPDVFEQVDQVTDSEAEKLRSQVVEANPQLESIMLADYLMDGDATWSPVPEWGCNAENHFFRPEDAEKGKSRATFTAQRAWQLLHKDAKSNAGTAATLGAIPSAEMASPSPRRELAHAPAAAGESAVFSGAWIGALAALILIAWAMFKRPA